MVGVTPPEAIVTALGVSVKSTPLVVACVGTVVLELLVGVLDWLVEAVLATCVDLAAD